MVEKAWRACLANKWYFSRGFSDYRGTRGTSKGSPPPRTNRRNSLSRVRRWDLIQYYLLRTSDNVVTWVHQYFEERHFTVEILLSHLVIDWTIDFLPWNSSAVVLHECTELKGLGFNSLFTPFWLHFSLTCGRQSRD